MRVVTAANDNKHFPELVKQCRESAERQGYPVEVYDLGGLGYGNQTFAGVGLSPLEACQLKPSVILDALGKLPSGELLVWADADALFVDTIDEVDTNAYDVGLIHRTLDTKQPFMSGVMFLYNREMTRAFIQAWKDSIPSTLQEGRQTLRQQGDQMYLNKFLFENPSFPVRIHTFSYLDYNNYELEPEPTTKIQHLKTGTGGSRDVWIKNRKKAIREEKNE
jgi:hypothetical protein